LLHLLFVSIFALSVWVHWYKSISCLYLWDVLNFWQNCSDLTIWEGETFFSFTESEKSIQNNLKAQILFLYVFWLPFHKAHSSIQGWDIGLFFIFLSHTVRKGLHSGVVVSTVALQQEGSWFESQAFPLGVYACMRGFSLGTPASSNHPKNIHVRLIGESVSVHGRVFLWWTSDSSRVYPASHPMTAGIRSSPPATLNWIKRV